MSKGITPEMALMMQQAWDNEKELTEGCNEAVRNERKSMETPPINAKVSPETLQTRREMFNYSDDSNDPSRATSPNNAPKPLKIKATTLAEVNENPRSNTI